VKRGPDRDRDHANDPRDTARAALVAAALACACVAGCNAVLGSDRYYTVPDGDAAAAPALDARGASPEGATQDAREVATDTGADAPPNADADAAADASHAADGADGADAALDACASDANGGCYACPPTTATQLQNACTNATCVPFDDRARLTRLLADGGLPPLPSPPTDAGGG
jgi:hypothetical protein